MNALEEILLRRKNIWVLPEHSCGYIGIGNIDKLSEEKRKAVAVASTLNKNIENLGYTLSKLCFKRLVNLVAHHELHPDDGVDCEKYCNDLVEQLKLYVGDNVEYEPMYPNFPKSVMENDELQLYVNAIIHYWTDGEYRPTEEKSDRLPLFDAKKVTVIENGSIPDEDELKRILHEDTNDIKAAKVGGDTSWLPDILQIFVNLCASKTSLSATDKKDIATILSKLPYAEQFLPEIPFKENMSYVYALCITTGKIPDSLNANVKTATDVLRIYTAMSDGDVSLASNTKFRNLRRGERRRLMDLLANCGNNLLEDMSRNANRWIRVGEKLHPGEFAKKEKYTKVGQAFGTLRNGGAVQSFAGAVEKYIADEEIVPLITLLKNRPGEFARRLDQLLRVFDNKDSRSFIIKAFAGCSSKVSSTVLLQVREHFINKLDGNDDLRVFFPKGNLAKSFCKPNDTENTIPEVYMHAIVNVCENTLAGIYGKRDFLGNVYISEVLKNYVVPFSQRSASKTLKTVTRGSRIAVDGDPEVIRPFIWWTNNKRNDEDYYYDRIDVDLSAVVFDENWKYLNHVSYTNLRDDGFGLAHSGDIVDGGSVDGKGAAEFVDINIAKAAECGGRYVVFNVYNYSDIPFSKMTHAMFGWMNREVAEAGEIFEPSTVEQRMDLTAATTTLVPVIFDLVEKEFIWCDMGVNADAVRHNFGGINVESNIPSVIAVCKSMVNMKKPNLYDLFALNARCRGNIVDNKEDADIVFDLDGDVTPFDTDVIVGQYL